MNVKVLRHSDGRPAVEINLVRVIGRRWFRVFVYVGPQVFTRVGFWRVRVDTMRGVNLRIGWGLGRPSILLLAHTRPSNWLDLERGPRL